MPKADAVAAAESMLDEMAASEAKQTEESRIEQSEPGAESGETAEVATPERNSPSLGEAVEAELQGKEDTPAGQKEPPKEPEPDVAKVRLQKLQEQLEAARARRAEQRESKRLAEERASFEREREEAKRHSAELKRQQELLDAARKDPRRLRDLGVDPVKFYDDLTKSVIEDDTPEARQRQLVEQLVQERLKQLEPKISKTEELEKKLQEMEAREQQRMQQQLAYEQIRAETEFLSITKQNGYEVVADYYDEDELVSIGNAVASDWATQGLRFTIKDVADFIRDALDGKLKRVDERRRQRQPVSESVSGQSVSVGKTAPAAEVQNAGKPKTVTGVMASATSATTERKLSIEERRRQAALQLEQLLGR